MVKYSNLSETEVKNLVIEKKWFASLSALLDGEMQGVSQQLTTNVTELAERYAKTLSQIDDDITILEKKVIKHLKIMGYAAGFFNMD